MSYGSVSALVAYLDRKETAVAQKRRYLKTVRKLPRNLRRFAVALKRATVDLRGPECDIRKKVCSILKIGRAHYFSLREKLDSTLPFEA